MGRMLCPRENLADSTKGFRVTHTKPLNFVSQRCIADGKADWDRLRRRSKVVNVATNANKEIFEKRSKGKVSAASPDVNAQIY